MRPALALAIGMAAALNGAALEPVPHPIGTQLEGFSLQDEQGKTHTLSQYAQERVLVLAFLGTECPLAKLYAPRLAELSRRFAGQGVQFLGINANCHDSAAEVAAYAREHRLPFPLFRDVGNQLADRLHAERTPEVFVMDADRIVRYRGRIDDQYGIGYARDVPARNDLQIAVEQLLADEPVAVASTEAAGCRIGRTRAASTLVTVNYAQHIAPLLTEHCVECHRDGEIGPFALTEYDEVVGWADTILEAVVQRRMPPWHADPDHGQFANERRLTDDQIALLTSWVAAGTPQGNPREIPPPRTWTAGWQLPRSPDFVAPISSTPVPVPAEGTVDYQYFQIDPGFAEDKWVSAVEIQPGNREVVHHVLMFAGTERDVHRRFGGGTRGYDGVYVPGQRVQPYPSGMAKRIAAGSQLIFQVHYTPNGTEQFDQSRVGIVFADPATVTHEVLTASAFNEHLQIPAGDSNFRVEAASPRLPDGAQLLSLNPHMHLRGKSFFYEAVLPDGSRKTLLNVPRYDFRWQTAYRLREPLSLPANTRLHCVAHFDNSADNLNNPDPTRTVGWGEQTWDEMMIGYVEYFLPKKASPEETSRRNRQQQRIEELFDRLDVNADQRVTPDELPGRSRWLFPGVDQDRSGGLDVEEIKAVLEWRRRLP